MPVIPVVERSCYVGIDIGKVKDPPAFCVLQRSRTFHPGPHGESVGWSRWSYAVRQLERLPLGTPYPATVRRILEVCEGLRDKSAEHGRFEEVVIDVTGVGRPILDLVLESRPGVRVLGVNYTAGNVATLSRDGSPVVNVPKRDLVACLVVLFQQKQIQIAAALQDAHALVTELVNFQETVSAAGRSTFGNDGHVCKHDDLVNCVALAAWRAVRRAPRELGVTAGPLFANWVP